jgi:hypothetical protein
MYQFIVRHRLVEVTLRLATLETDPPHVSGGRPPLPIVFTRRCDRSRRAGGWHVDRGYLAQRDLSATSAISSNSYYAQDSSLPAAVRLHVPRVLRAVWSSTTLHTLCDSSPAERDCVHSDDVTGRRSATNQALGSNLCMYVLVGVMLHSCCSETLLAGRLRLSRRLGPLRERQKSP